jgi:multiple sugar transport system substrate-binding protein
MKSMKRIIASIILVATLLTGVVASLTSCGGNKGGGNGPAPDFVMPEGGYNGQEVTITFYHSMGQNLEKVLQQAIKDFNVLYPKITVVAKKFDSYDVIHEKISKEVTVGSQPNLTICYPDHVATYNEAGAVQSLDTLINSTATATRADGSTEQIGFTQAQIDDFIPAYWAEGKAFADGKTYVLPGYKSTELLYYNKTYLDDMFGEGQYTIPTTWAEMEAFCAQIKANADDPESMIPLGYDSTANLFITLCEQFGSEYTSPTGEKFLFDNAENKEFVKMLRRWYENGWLIVGDDKTYTSTYFTGSGETETRCVMCIGSSGGATYQRPTYTTVNGETVYDFEVGIAPIPQQNPSAPKVISQGPSVCIFKKTNAVEVLASYLFAKFLSTDYSFQGGVSQTNGYVPVIKSIQNFAPYADWLAQGTDTAHLEAYAARVTFENYNSLFTSPVFWGSAEARNQAETIVNNALKQPADGGVDALIDKIFAEAIRRCKTSIGER